ncbi:hypothetical protein BD413DRAFT_670576 [Trametes elegans]|nr:hypothetical protein BD413DRAFT_670576 [Trametes elegans]
MPAVTTGSQFDERASQSATSTAVDSLSQHSSPERGSDDEPGQIADDVPFFIPHLNSCPPPLLEQIGSMESVRRLSENIMTMGSEIELYGPIADLLTAVSRIVFDSLPSAVKDHFPGAPILFLNHHTASPTQFPAGTVIDGTPDIIGAFGIEGGFDTDGEAVFKNVPYHRIETFVETKEIYAAKEGSQAIQHVCTVQQARPDRPGFYCIRAKPQKYFQVVFSSPCGLVTSELAPWNDMDAVCAYIYSLYVPPDGHLLYDRTITWKEPANCRLGPPTWTVKTKDTTYTDAMAVFLGDPLDKRTTILRARGPDDSEIIIKEFYLPDHYLYKEHELLEHIHAEGDMPGVVRSASGEAVVSDGCEVILKLGSVAKRKYRIVLVDVGVRLELAKSINDVLMTAYDALEVHRTLVRERSVLHRDMSLFNVLMYPRCASRTENPKGFYKDHPALISQVLAGKPTNPAKRVARCMLIDFDNGTLVDGDDPQAIRRELACLAGTPMFIARAVSAGEPPGSPYWHMFSKMPSLSEQAFSLYVAAYGEDRYNRYNDGEGTYHGGVTSSTHDMEETDNKVDHSVPFYHRQEYDAESVYWTLFVVLLRVVPQDSDFSETAQHMLCDRWQHFEAHRFSGWHLDSRNMLINYAIGPRRERHFFPMFPPSMEGVARLLIDMTKQIVPSYSLMNTPPPHDDHLHEALQRLILNYLVENHDNPIPLTPGSVRAVAHDAINPVVLVNPHEFVVPAMSTKIVVPNSSHGQPGHLGNPQDNVPLQRPSPPPISVEQFRAHPQLCPTMTPASVPAMRHSPPMTVDVSNLEDVDGLRGPPRKRRKYA